MAAPSGTGVQLDSRGCRVVSTRKRHSSNGGENSKKVDFDFMGTLPDEIIIKILSYLHPNEVDVVGSTSRRLRELSVSASVARTVNLTRHQNWGMDKMKKYLRRHAGKIQVLNLSNNPWISAKSLKGLIFAMGAVTWLDVTGCCVDQRCLDDILSTAVQLKSLAFTDRAFSFTPAPNLAGLAGDQTRPVPNQDFLSKVSLGTLSSLTHLRMVLTACCTDLSLVVFCPSLLSLTLHGHFCMSTHCECIFQNLKTQHFSGLRELCWTPALCHRHGNIPTFMKDVIISLQEKSNTLMTKLMVPMPCKIAEDLKMKRIPFMTSLTHLDLPTSDMEPDIKMLTSPLRYLRLNMSTALSPSVEHLLRKTLQLQNLCLYTNQPCQDEGTVAMLLAAIYNGLLPHLEGLNCALSCFQHVIKSNELESLPQMQGELPVVKALNKLKELQSLSLPICALLHHKKTSIFDDEGDLDDKTDKRGSRTGTGLQCNLLPTVSKTGQSNKRPDSDALASLTKACPYLKKLELIDSHTSVSLFSTDSPLHSARHQCSTGRDQLTDTSLPSLASLSFLTHLTLAGLQNVRHGRGLVDITKGCGQLSYLSLANLGLQGDCTFLPALCEALKHATNLADFRLEHRFLSISTRLLESLASCPKLRRLCLITETGCVERSTSFGDLIESCAQLILLLVISNDSDTARRSMKREIKNKKKTRTQLSVVFGSADDIRNQRGCHDTLKFVFHQDLREVVLFDSHVCQPEPHMDIS